VEAQDALRYRMNDDRRRRFGTPDRTIALLCECGDPECHRTVLVSADEYDALRPGPIVHAEHDEPRLDDA
jgi:hypothetical protein